MVASRQPREPPSRWRATAAKAEQGIVNVAALARRSFSEGGSA